MINEIVKVTTIAGKLVISDEGVRWLKGEGEQDKWSNDEDSVVENMPTIKRSGDVNDVHMDWTGDGSRSAMADGGLAKFASFTTGTAHIVFVDTQGQLFSVRIENGKLAWHEVHFTIGQPCDPPEAFDDDDGW